MTWFIYNWFSVVISRQILSVELRVAGQSRKLVRKLLQAYIRKLLIIYKARQVALKRSQEDRTLFWAIILQFTVNQLVFIDESRADSKTGIQKASQLLVGVILVLYILYNSSKPRVNILPIYTFNSVLISLVYSGLINAEGYNYQIKHVLLPYYNPYLALRLVVVIDNASFYYLVYIYTLFKQASVKLIYLPIYLSNLNLIKEFFSKLKEFIQQYFILQKEALKQQGNSFNSFLSWYIEIIGSKSNSARAYFRYSGYISRGE